MTRFWNRIAVCSSLHENRYESPDHSINWSSSRQCIRSITVTNPNLLLMSSDHTNETEIDIARNQTHELSQTQIYIRTGVRPYTVTHIHNTIHIYTNTYIRTHIYKYTYTYTYIHIHCIHTHLNTHSNHNTHTHSTTHTHAHTNIHIHLMHIYYNTLTHIHKHYTKIINMHALWNTSKQHI